MTPYGDRSESTVAQVMACWLTAPSHYLNQCWLIISEVQWHSYYRGRAVSQKMPQPSVTKIYLKITYLKLHSNFPGANELTNDIFQDYFTGQFIWVHWYASANEAILMKMGKLIIWTKTYQCVHFMTGILYTIAIIHIHFHAFMPCDAYMRQQTRPSLVQIMAWRLFGAKPLSEPMLAYC